MVLDLSEVSIIVYLILYLSSLELCRYQVGVEYTLHKYGSFPLAVIYVMWGKEVSRVITDCEVKLSCVGLRVKYGFKYISRSFTDSHCDYDMSCYE